MKPDWTVPATLLADPEWVRARIGGAAKLYGCARPEVLGTIWWYSLSSVLVAPAVESLMTAALTGRPWGGEAVGQAVDREQADRAVRLERTDRAGGTSPFGTPPRSAPTDSSALSASADPTGSAGSAGSAAADQSANPAPAQPSALSASTHLASPAAAEHSAGTSPVPPSALATSGHPAARAAAGHSAGAVLADPSLDAMELDLLADGRFLGARSTRSLSGGLPELGAALGGALDAVIKTVAAVTGARARALGAIAIDSIGNRLLWTPDPERAMALAEPLVAAIGLDLPKPRFVRVGRTPAVRRASCCLIYEVGNPKCVSCPRQTPAERDARLRAALG